MQIVIELDEKVYNGYMNYTENYVDFKYFGAEEKIVRAIRKGTPLPPKESCGSCRHAITLDREAYCKKCSRYYRSMYDPMEYD